MNKQMLYKLKLGSKVQLSGRVGTLTNASPFGIFKTYEITFENGDTITREEMVDMDTEGLIIVPEEDYYGCFEARKKLMESESFLMKKVQDMNKKITDLEERLKVAVNKVQQTTIEGSISSKLTKEEANRLLTTIGEKPLVVVDYREPVLDIPGDIESATPIGVAVGLATEVAKVLNRENVEKILKESGGRAKIGMIAEKLDSSAKAVYRFISKSTGMFVGKLPEPEYKEEDAYAWLEDQQEVSEPETEGVSDAPVSTESPESSPESGIPTDDERSDERSEDAEGGS